MGTMEILDPVARVSAVDQSLTARIDLGTARRIALLDNSKMNVEHVLAGLEEQVRVRLPEVQLVRYRKRSPSDAAHESLLEELATFDAVINGVGD